MGLNTVDGSEIRSPVDMVNIPLFTGSMKTYRPGSFQGLETFHI